MPLPPDLSKLTSADKDALILGQVEELRQQNAALAARVATLEQPANSSIPPSKGLKVNRPDQAKRTGPRKGSLGRKGGGRPLAQDPDQCVVAKAAACAHCHGALCDADQTLQARYDKIDRPGGDAGRSLSVLRRGDAGAGRHGSRCRTAWKPVPDGMEAGAGRHGRGLASLLALALYLRFTPAIS